MSEQLLPASLQAWMTEMDRRVRVMETTARVGISAIGWARQTDSGTNITTFSAWQDGNNTNTWLDYQGAIGVHYPRVSVTIGPSGQCLVIISASPNSIGPLSPNGFKSQQMFLGIGIDGVDPSGGLRYRTFTNSNVWSGETQLTFVETITGLSPGLHEFKVWTIHNNNGGSPTFIPQLNTAEIVAIPI